MSETGVPDLSALGAAQPQAGIYTTNAPAPANDAQKPAVDIVRLKKMFDDARTGNEVSRKDSELSRDYYDGYQYTPGERARLDERGQPIVENNRIRGAVNGVLGVMEMGKTDPRAYLRNPGEAPKPQRPAPSAPQQPGQPPQMGTPQLGQQVMGGNGGPPLNDPPLDAADVATMTLRFISDTTHFQATKMDVLENGLVEGSGAAIFEVQGQNVMATQIRWEEFFYDPRSRRHDFKDARYMGVAKWMYADMLSAIYPEMAEKLNGFITTGSIDGFGFDMTWEDRPNTNVTLPWFDRAQKRLMVVEMYHIEAQTWMRDVFFAGGPLESGPSPYQDNDNRPTNPIEAYSSYVDRNNNRVGIVRDMRPLQDEVNKRRSKALHEISTRQIQQTDPTAPPVDADEARKEAAKPDGVVPPGWSIVARSDVVANNMQLLAEAKAEIERFSPNPAILGRQGADASGRAVQVRQQAGMTELARVLGRFNDWEFRCYRQMWARARQFWKDPQWIRVTDNLGAPQYVRVNDPVHAVDPQTGQPAIDPQTGKPVLSHVKNDIAKMDIDIIIDSVPDTATLEQEIFEELSKLAQTYGPQNVPFSLVVEMSSLPKKRELIQKLEAFMAQQQQAQAQALQQKMQMETAGKQAEIASDTATARNKNAQALLYEVQAVAQALQAHVKAMEAAAAEQALGLPPIGLPDGAPGAIAPQLPPPQNMPPQPQLSPPNGGQ
jgi:hypothetical protein